MNVHILDCDRVDPALLHIGGEYSDMFISALSPIRPDWQFQVYWPQEGELPEINDTDIYLITGSRADSFSDDEWVAVLRSWLVEADRIQARVLGICFGHQIIAHALGGRADRKGAWGVGRMPAETFGLPFEQANLLVSHQDQVMELPPGADRVMGSEFCPNFAFVYKRMIGIQGHPEFTPEYSAALANARRSRISDARVDEALDTLSEPLNAQAVLEWAADTLENA
jgi:GMP synthase-like glutamine amidotransferase